MAPDGDEVHRLLLLTLGRFGFEIFRRPDDLKCQCVRLAGDDAETAAFALFRINSGFLVLGGFARLHFDCFKGASLDAHLAAVTFFLVHNRQESVDRRLPEAET